jgi:hypothetical protein
LIVRYSGNSAFIHSFDAGSNFFVPCAFDLAAFSWLIQIERQSDERQSLVSRQLDDFLGYLSEDRLSIFNNLPRGIRCNWHHRA